jgi:hypothetical protein
LIRHYQTRQHNASLSTDENRRHRNIAPFVRRTGERKAQTCAKAIYQQLRL